MAKKPSKKVAKKKRPAGKAKSVRRAAVKKSKKAATPKSKRKKGKAAVKRPKTTPPLILPWRRALPGETLVGVVDDFFSHIGVVTFTVQAPLEVGDQIHIRGHTTDLTLRVTSMQENRAAIQKASPKQGVGIKVDGKCRRGDYVYLVS